jgi:hypothetical protein
MWALVNMEMNLSVPCKEGDGDLVQLVNHQHLKKNAALWSWVMLDLILSHRWL